MKRESKGIPMKGLNGREVVEVLNKIKLHDGTLDAYDIAAEGYVTYRIGMTVKVVRDYPVNETKLCEISTTGMIRYDVRALSEEDVIRHAQRLWTSMWMHESLETFQYEDRLPFDPHCRESLWPNGGDFLRDDQCSVVELKK